jgi:hypothetical protein
MVMLTSQMPVSGEFGNTYCPEAKIPNHFRMETTGVRDGNLENS